MSETYYTPVQIATRLQVTRRTVYRWLTEDKLQGLRAGSGWRIPDAELRRFMGERELLPRDAPRG